MKKSSLAFLLALIVLPSLSQVTKKTLELTEFKSIYNNSSYTIYLKQTNKQEVNVEALTEIFELTKIEVVDGILMVNVDRKPDNPNKSVWAKIDDIKVNPTMKLYVSVKNLAELQVNGNGKIVSENSLASGNLALSVSGNGSMDVDIKGEVLKAEVSGPGRLTLRGYASSCEALVSGSGSITAFDCPIETCKVKVSGPGIAELNVSNTIDALVVGSGIIKHKGNTKNATKKVYGSGTVDRAY